MQGIATQQIMQLLLKQTRYVRPTRGFTVRLHGEKCHYFLLIHMLQLGI